MEKSIVDSVFGKMEYKHRWVKTEELWLMGKVRTLRIIAEAYSNEEICEQQRTAYKLFRHNVSKLDGKIATIVDDYLILHKDEIEEFFSGNINEGLSLLEPTSVLFSRTGKVIILCNAKWDEENGIGIQILPEYKMDLQDAFL